MNADEARRILKLNGKATPQDIRRAYRNLAKRYHPDFHHCHTYIEIAYWTRKFIELKEAHDFLSSHNNISLENIGQQGEQEDFDYNDYTESEKAGDFNGNKRKDLFAWLFKKLPASSGLIGQVFWILMIAPIILVGLWITLTYAWWINIDVEKSKRYRLIFTVISSLTALVYCGIIIRSVLAISRWDSIISVYINSSAIISALVIVAIMVSEWLSLFLAFIWHRSIESEREILMLNGDQNSDIWK